MTGTDERTRAFWPRRPRARSGIPRPERLGVVLVGLVAAVVGAGSVLAVAHRDRGPAAAPTPTTAPCSPLPYQPCGGSPAPFTDGRQCVQDHADYDGNPRNGCEAAALGPPDGTVIGTTVRANLVPADDVDTFRFHVDDHFQLLCNGKVSVTLTAPAGVAQRVEVLDENGGVVDRGVSEDAAPTTLAVHDPDCLFSDAQVLSVRISTVRGHSATPYTLTRSGSF